MAPPPSLQDLIDTVHQDAGSQGALDQLVTAAATAALLEDTTDALLGYFVDRCRREGRSWSDISTALGVTKQAVHKRFATTMADQVIAAIPHPTLERFTLRARGVLGAASRATKAAGQDRIGSADLLLGLFSQPEGIAARVLQEMHVTKETVEAAIRAGAGAGTAGQADPAGEAGTADDGQDAGDADKKFTPDGRRALRDALAFALEQAHNYIGTEHLLIGLYGDPGSPAAVILTQGGGSEREARARVLEQLRGCGSRPGRA